MDKNYTVWKNRIQKFKEMNGVPTIESREDLIEFLERVDAYLIMSDYTIIHSLLGKKYRKVKGECKETRMFVLGLRKAKELMDCKEWMDMRDKAYENSFGDVKKAIGRKAEIQLERKVDEGVMEAIKVALNYSEKWIPTQKTNKGVNEKDFAKKVAEQIKTALAYDAMRKKVSEMKGNN